LMLHESRGIPSVAELLAAREARKPATQICELSCCELQADFAT
jgi:hypothetical protein